MREFFKGWRRRVALVTLAMACVLMAAWMRSDFAYEAAGFGCGNRQHILVAMNGAVTWIAVTEKSPEVGWSSADISDVASIEQELDLYRSEPGLGEWVVPYWSLVLPLTLLSAWLLLIKPRPAKSAKESSRV